jgi:hypothetical protein
MALKVAEAWEQGHSEAIGSDDNSSGYGSLIKAEHAKDLILSNWKGHSGVPVSVATSGATTDASPAFNSTTNTRATDVSIADGSFPDVRLDSSDSAGAASATTIVSPAFDSTAYAIAVSAVNRSFPDVRLD